MFSFHISWFSDNRRKFVGCLLIRLSYESPFFSLFFYCYLLLLKKSIFFFLDYLINTNNIIGAQIHFSFKEAEAEGDSFIIIIVTFGS
jgi:hypothetical protein